MDTIQIYIVVSARINRSTITISCMHQSEERRRNCWQLTEQTAAGTFRCHPQLKMDILKYFKLQSLHLIFVEMEPVFIILEAVNSDTVLQIIATRNVGLQKHISH